MVREYQARLKAAQAEKPAARSRDNIQMILARCGALLLDIDDQLDKVESGKPPHKNCYDSLTQLQVREMCMFPTVAFMGMVDFSTLLKCPDRNSPQCFFAESHQALGTLNITAAAHTFLFS